MGLLVSHNRQTPSGLFSSLLAEKRNLPCPRFVFGAALNDAQKYCSTRRGQTGAHFAINKPLLDALVVPRNRHASCLAL